MVAIAVTRGRRARATNRHRTWGTVAVLGLLFVTVTQLVLTAHGQSATMDEQVHIARGVSYLRTGDLRLIREHPPLIGILSAIPLALDHSLRLPLNSWKSASTYRFADEFVWKANSNGPSIVFRARLPIIVLTVLLGLSVFTWAREMHGFMAGLLALTLTTFDPNVLAHGGLATNDLGVTLFWTLSAYTFWRFLSLPTRTRAAVAGLMLGLALTAKFSAVSLIPGLALMVLVDRRRLRLWVDFAIVGFVAVTTIWAVYGFEIGPVGVGGSWLPAPSYLRGLLALTRDVQGGMPAFLLGAYSTSGWWYYFPVAFAVKTPLPTLLLCAACLAYSASARLWRQDLTVLAPAIIYFAVALTSKMNLGYRHLLPVLPLLFVFTSRLSRFRWRSAPKRAALAAALLVWLVVGTMSSSPHFLAYFNELAAARRHEILSDSNLDWGQDLPALRDYMHRTGLSSVKLSYFGSALPEAYGIHYEPLPSFPRNSALTAGEREQLAHPPPGTYAISVSNLQGVVFADHDLYSWFRERKPDAVIGHSIFVYRVHPVTPR